MALFRKLFYRKPPDGLLEICERVYVFDCCFTTDALEDQDYNGYVGGIVTQLREIYPDASILAFNFREGDTHSEIGNALSEYDMTIMEYPRHYEGCPLLPMEVVHHFLRSSESWLSLGQQNVLLMHCERGGWPVLAFMLAALLIYRKHYSGELKTLDMVHKQAPRELLHLLSPLNPIPSQLRYLQYVSRRNVATQWPPLDRALTLDCIMIRMIPKFDSEGGCRPIFRIYGQDPRLVSDRAPKVLFSTPKKNRTVRHYKQAECEIVKVDINCQIQGDVVFECISLHADMEREVMMFRVMFNTAFIRSNILMLNRDEIDILWDAKDLFPKDFRAEVLFSEMDTVPSVVPVDSSCFEEKDGLPVEAFAKVQEMFSSVDWLSPKGETAVEVLQQLAVSNTVIEAYSHAARGAKSLAKSPADLALEYQSNLSRKSSPNADVSRNQAEPQFSPTKIGPIISSKKTPTPSGDHSPPSSTSPRHQLSIAKTLPFSPNQESDSDEIGKVKHNSSLSEAETAYPNNSPSGSPAQSKDATFVPGQSLLSPAPFPITPSLEEKIGPQKAFPSLGLLTPEIPSVSTPSKDDIISCPLAESPRSHDKNIGDEPPKSKPPAPPPPPMLIHSSVMVNVGKSTGFGSLSPSATPSLNLDDVQVTEGGSPAPHLSSPKTDTTLKPAPRTPPSPNVDGTLIKENSTSICPTPPAPLPPPTSHFKENSECVVGPSSPPFTSYKTHSSAVDRPASCPPPPLLPSHETSSFKGRSPLSAPPHPPPPPPPPLLKEHYAPEVVPPPPLTPPLRDISVARPVPCPPPPPPRTPKEISSGAESTSPYSWNDAPSSAPPLKDSLVTGPAPCPPPPPPLPPKEIYGGGEPPPVPPLQSGQDTTNLPTLSPPPPPPPPPAGPTTRSSSIPSAPPPPSAGPTTRSSSIPSAPPPDSPTASSPSIPSAPPPPASPTTRSSPSIPSAPPPPPASPTTRSSPSIPSAPPPPPASPTTRSSPSIPSAPPPPPASPTTRSSPSIPSAPPPPPASPTTRSSPSIPSAPPPPPASPTTRSSPSIPSAPPPPPASPTTRGSPSVPSAPPPPFPSTNDPASLTTSGRTGSTLPGSPSPPGPPPPTTPPLGTKGKSLLSRTIRNNQTKKLKPLHWLKISRAVSGSLWAEAQKSGEASRAPEIDISELESLFSAAVPTSDQGGSGRKTGSRGSMGNKPEKVQLIEHRRAYNCEIMLSKVKIPLHDMLSSVLALEDSSLDVDQVENLIKFSPTKEEMEVLKGYKGERDKLGKCEQFFLELMQVPRIEFKLRVYSFKIQFRSQVSDLRNNLNIVNSAADQIRGSGKLRRIMQTILNLGNALNQGTARGSAVGFRLDSLLKLTDTRARNNKMTLMHYLCKVLSDQLPELLDFWKDLSSLELASKIQLKFLAEEMQAINKGLEKVMQELSMSESDGPVSDKFRKALKEFLCFSEGEVRTLASLYAGVGRNVDSLILYFGEDPARCPFEQVISTLLNFVRMFKQAHEENCKQIELEKKKAEKEALEKMKMNAPDTGHLLQSEVRSVK